MNCLVINLLCFPHNSINQITIMNSILILVVFVLSICVSSAFFLPSSRIISKQNTLKMSSFYDIVEKDAQGNDVSFSQYRGKVVYGVNVASRCGYTASGYALLAKIAAMKASGVEVAIFPCNQVSLFLLIITC